MKVPLLDLQAHHAPIKKELMAAIEDVVTSGTFILGPQVDKLEKDVARLSNTQHAIGVSSGTDALLVALMALGIRPGDEVLTTAYSFFATAGVVSRLGAIPRFVDIDPKTYNIDPRKIEAAITQKTKAIIAVHLFGQCADMDAILKIARSHGLKVVEDAAQAIGAEYPGGRQAGSMGDIGCFSFFPSKNLGAMGDAGIVVTNDKELGERLRILRTHGAKPKYYHKFIGGNFRIDAMQAAILNVKLPHLAKWSELRRSHAATYETLLENCGLNLPVRQYKGYGLQFPHIYNQFVLRAPSGQRDRIRQALQENGVGTEVYYPVPFHLQECFADLGYRPGDHPESESAANDTFALPIYPELQRPQIEYVAEQLKHALELVEA